MFTFLFLVTFFCLIALFVFSITSYQDRKEKAFYAELTKDEHLYEYDYDESGYLVYKRITSLLID